MAMLLLLVLLCAFAGSLLYNRLHQEINLAEIYEEEHYNQAYYKTELFAQDLCVVPADEEISEDTINASALKSAGLFDVNHAETLCAYQVHQKLYPASTTKILTALVAIKHADLSDVVTVGINADAEASFAADESTIGLKEGDQLTMEDLLYGLILYSGNDAAVAIAEHVAGSSEDFAQLMNEQAAELMATNSHFVNANGLHDEDHYTTAYDLYLIFNACIKEDTFCEIIEADSYTAEVTGKDGSVRELEFEPTNYYASGDASLPDNGNVIGGKTGTTKDAGNCLVLLDENEEGDPFISIVMGADTKELLYQNMTTMINTIE